VWKETKHAFLFHLRYNQLSNTIEKKVIYASPAAVSKAGFRIGLEPMFEKDPACDFW
jgi:hypothetical protein